MGFIYIHTLSRTNRPNMFRVYKGLLISGPQTGTGEALILYIDESQAVRVTSERHFDQRNSACYWVQQHEFDKLKEAIETDWELRHFWKEAYDDVQEIKQTQEKDPLPF
jgi:hypothetical protein